MLDTGEKTFAEDCQRRDRCLYWRCGKVVMMECWWFKRQVYTRGRREAERVDGKVMRMDLKGKLKIRWMNYIREVMQEKERTGSEAQEERMEDSGPNNDSVWKQEKSVQNYKRTGGVLTQWGHVCRSADAFTVSFLEYPNVREGRWGILEIGKEVWWADAMSLVVSVTMAGEQLKDVGVWVEDCLTHRWDRLHKHGSVTWLKSAGLIECWYLHRIAKLRK